MNNIAAIIKNTKRKVAAEAGRQKAVDRAVAKAAQAKERRRNRRVEILSDKYRVAKERLSDIVQALFRQSSFKRLVRDLVQRSDDQISLLALKFPTGSLRRIKKVYRDFAVGKSLRQKGIPLDSSWPLYKLLPIVDLEDTPRSTIILCLAVAEGLKGIRLLTVTKPKRGSRYHGTGIRLFSYDISSEINLEKMTRLQDPQVLIEALISNQNPILIR